MSLLLMSCSHGRVTFSEGGVEDCEGLGGNVFMSVCRRFVNIL